MEEVGENSGALMSRATWAGNGNWCLRILTQDIAHGSVAVAVAVVRRRTYIDRQCAFNKAVLLRLA
jgi:hypothetical protein